MKKIFNKKINLALFTFGLFLISANISSAQVYVSSNQYNYVIPVTVAGPEVNNLPLCDSTYRLNCPFNVRCRNINGMIAYACPAAYANQPLNNTHNNAYTNNTNYYNNDSSYINNSYVYNSNYTNNLSNINYDIYARGQSRFVNSPVYFENGAYYTNPVIRPNYELNPTQNQTNYYSYYSNSYYYSY